jgi:lysophospholipase L1-like esterase
MNIAVWGDSITYGEGDAEALGWVGRMRRRLLSAGGSAPEKEPRVYNRGICGDTSYGLSQRFETEASAIGPDRIAFAIGINDAKFPSQERRNKVPREEFERHMRALLSHARTFTDDVVVVGLTQVDEGANLSPSTFLNEEIRAYDSMLQALAAEVGCRFVSMWEALNPKADLMDGLHPNAAGYEKMADAFLKDVPGSGVGQ